MTVVRFVLGMFCHRSKRTGDQLSGINDVTGDELSLVVKYPTTTYNMYLNWSLLMLHKMVTFAQEVFSSQLLGLAQCKGALTLSREEIIAMFPKRTVSIE